MNRDFKSDVQCDIIDAFYGWQEGVQTKEASAISGNMSLEHQFF